MRFRPDVVQVEPPWLQESPQLVAVGKLKFDGRHDAPRPGILPGCDDNRDPYVPGLIDISLLLDVLRACRTMPCHRQARDDCRVQQAQCSRARIRTRSAAPAGMMRLDRPDEPLLFEGGGGVVVDSAGPSLVSGCAPIGQSRHRPSESPTCSATSFSAGPGMDPMALASPMSSSSSSRMAPRLDSIWL